MSHPIRCFLGIGTFCVGLSGGVDFGVTKSPNWAMLSDSTGPGGLWYIEVPDRVELSNSLERQRTLLGQVADGDGGRDGRRYSHARKEVLFLF
ncbi:hypothetical protein AAHA92_23995 [Salvia divinorum]|uniref:Secreted protein n=1 Tax=Salvia divinorum TaxID=28513 RepID=A0ABD1G6M8_SALDI